MGRNAVHDLKEQNAHLLATKDIRGTERMWRTFVIEFPFDIGSERFCNTDTKVKVIKVIAPADEGVVHYFYFQLLIKDLVAKYADDDDGDDEDYETRRARMLRFSASTDDKDDEAEDNAMNGN
jgi:hypothetical protein